MYPTLKIAAVAVLALAVGVVIDPLRPPAPFGASDPSGSPSAGPSPRPLRDGPLSAGAYVAMPFTSPGSDACYQPPQSGCSETIPDDDIRLMFNVPEGLSGITDLGFGLPVGGVNTPEFANVIIERGAWLRTDPCTGAVSSAADIPVGPSAADFAAALDTHPLLDVTTPVDVTLAGYSGKFLELRVPQDIARCSEYQPWDPGIWTEWPGERWLLWVLDVDGLRVVVREHVHEATSPEVLAQLQGVLDSMTIEGPTAPAASPGLSPST